MLKKSAVPLRIALRLQAQERWAVLAVWLVALALVAVFASPLGVLVGLPSLLVAGGVATLAFRAHQARRTPFADLERSSTMGADRHAP